MAPGASSLVSLREVLVCPACLGPLTSGSKGLRCKTCRVTYPLDAAGFVRFPVRAGGAEDSGERLEDYLARQEAGGGRFVRDWLLPYLEGAGIGPEIGAAMAPARVLDAGCGAGEVVAELVAAGLDAVGLDLPKAAKAWAASDRDRDRFVCGDVTSLPFATATFDVVTAFGVIEHVGTVVGHLTLAPDAEEQRRAFARELLRVVRPGGGRIVVACPNRSFPVDLHHGASDAVGPRRPIRSAISRTTGLSIHPTWGRQPLLSFDDLTHLFRASDTEVSALPLTGYFAFGSVPATLRGLAKAYVERLPSRLRSSAANPFVLAEITRGPADRSPEPGVASPA